MLIHVMLIHVDIRDAGKTDIRPSRSKGYEGWIKVRNTHQRTCTKCFWQFCKVHSKTSALKYLSDKVSGLIVGLFIKKKTLAKAFSCKFSKIFKKTCFAEHVQTDDRMSEKNQKNCIQKIYLQENTGDAVLFSTVTDMWTYSFSKTCFITDAFLWKLRSLTEHQFYRTMLRDYLWFPVPFAMYHLFYQW